MVRLSILCWDPSMRKQLPLPALELPVHCGDIDQRFMLRLLDIFMNAARDFVVGLLYDAATPHQVIRRVLHGNPTPDDLVLLKDPSLRFFNRVVYKDLPAHCLPRFPVRLAMVEGQVYFGIGGPCNLKLFGFFWIPL